MRTANLKGQPIKMSPLLSYLALLLLFTFVTTLTVKHLKKISYAWKIPSYPTSLPGLGHVFLLLGKNTEQAFKTMVEMFSTTQRMTKLQLGPLPLILVHHPDLLQKIFTAKDLYDKPFFYDFMKLGRGLITERCGWYWKQIRKAVNPAFSMKILGGFVPMFDERALKLVEKLQPLADGVTSVNLLQYASQCTLEMVFSTTMGLQLNELPREKEYSEHLERIQQSLGKRILNIEMFLEPIYRFTNSYRNEMQSRAFCNVITDPIIQERRMILDSVNNKDGDEKNLDSLQQYRKSYIFLDEILQYRHNGTPLCDREVTDNVYTMMAAGNDTTALAISYACLFLAQHQDIQNKVVAEMQAVFYSPSVELNIETLKKLQYTEMVLNETLRLVPVVPFASRETGAEIELDGVRIPPGEILVVNFYSLHRRPDIWGDDADRFDPERFRPEAVRERHPYGYLPFSAGFRNCIGKRYAMNSLKTMLTRLLMAFEVRTNLRMEDMRYKFEITLKLVGPHEVQLIRRDRSNQNCSDSIDIWQK